MIEIVGLEKRYGDQIILKDIDLKINKGTIFGIAGRSGVGKSTLLRCMNGMEGYDRGEIRVGGSNLKEMSSKELKNLRGRMGMIFQDFVLLERLNVYDNIALPLRSWKKSNSFIDERVKELVELVGIQEKLYDRPNKLSGGQKQRVAIARALALEPEVLLCDEATSALDPNTVKSIMNLLTDINKALNITIVMVTHQMSVVKSMCEEMAIIEEGKVAVSGSVTEVFMNEPKALERLIGIRNVENLEGGITVRIVLDDKTFWEPILTKMARETGVDFLVMSGQEDQYREHRMRTLWINVQAVHLKEIIAYLDKNKVSWKVEDINV